MNFNCPIIGIFYFMVTFISRNFAVPLRNSIQEYTILVASDFQEHFDCNNNEDKDLLTQMKRILSESDACTLYVGNILNTRHDNANIRQRIRKAIRILRYLEPDIMMFGINEVIYGKSVLTQLAETFHNIPSNNAKYSSSNLLFPNNCPAIIGYVSESTDQTAIANTEISNLTAYLEQLAASYKQKKYPVIAVGCQNLTSIEEIVKKTSSILLIIDGCSGSELKVSTLVNSHNQRVGAVFPQTSIHFLTKIFIRIKHDGKEFILDNYNASKLTVTPSNRIFGDHYQIQAVAGPVVTHAKSHALGKAMTFLNGQCYRSECNFGSLITDAFVQYKCNNYRGSNWTDTAIAVIAAGMIFSSINATANSNTIHREDIEYAVYNDKLVTIEISGMDIRRSLNHAFDVTYKQGDAKFLQVSGLRIIYDPLKQSLQKLISVKVRTTVGVPTYTLLIRSVKYYVVMPKSLANGEFGHNFFKKYGIIREENMTVVDAVCQYITQLKSIYYFNEDRILVQSSFTSSVVKITTPRTMFGSIVVVIITFIAIY